MKNFFLMIYETFLLIVIVALNLAPLILIFLSGVRFK